MTRHVLCSDPDVDWSADGVFEFSLSYDGPVTYGIGVGRSIWAIRRVFHRQLAQVAEKVYRPEKIAELARMHQRGFQHNQINFVPLALLGECLCGLDIVIAKPSLRYDLNLARGSNGFLDVVIAALTMPRHSDSGTPRESPFFCLLESNTTELVGEVSVDATLDDSGARCDRCDASVGVNVKIQPFLTPSAIAAIAANAPYGWCSGKVLIG